MSTHKQIDRICCGALLLVLLLTIVFMNAGKFGVQAISRTMGYESRLFDTTTVHTIDIEMEDWDAFLEGCTNEEYVSCSLAIDQEACKNVAIRAKGNTSLTSVEAYGNNRYSFKVEFDHYDPSNTYYGLDKLCLNNIIQDNTYMKDYVSYQMMSGFGVDSPLCSYVYLTVNGEDFGLYLAVEGVEESFLERNYGNDYGELYKPDSMSMGGGRGNGAGFDPGILGEAGNQQENLNGHDGKINRGIPGMEAGKSPGGPDKMVMGSDDVSLIYTDDEYDSYSNIFDHAKTEITDSDKDRLIASLKKLNEAETLETVVDIEEVIRYFTVHNFVCNFDSYTGSMIHNYYLYEKDGQLSMIPWDYNLAFGGFESGTDAEGLVNYPIDSPVSGGTVESRPMLAWIFADEEYTEQYHQYFAEFIEQYFTNGEFEQMIDTVSEMIAPYVEKDPTKFCTYEEFQTGVSTLKSFCMLRAESIKGQLDGTISSTETARQTVLEEQQTGDPEAEEAVSLSIEAMGTMGNTFGAGNGPGEFMRETADFTGEDKPAAEVSGRGNDFRTEEFPDGTKAQEGIPDGTKMQEGFPDGTKMQEGFPGEMKMQEGIPDGTKMQEGIPDGTKMLEEFPGEMKMQEEIPEGMKTAEEIPERNSLILAASSAAVLLAGIFYALRYTRYV